MIADLANEMQKNMPPPPFDPPSGFHWQIGVSMFKNDDVVNFQGKWQLKPTIYFDESFGEYS